MNLTDTLLTRISQMPSLWNVLRRIVEDNFRGEKAIIAQELAPWHDRETAPRMFLDLGCGTGEFAPAFPANHYVGVDLSVTYLRYARQTYHGAFVASSGEYLALASEQFDAALVLGVLHHMPDDLAARCIQELYRVLRPGAVALVMEDIPPPGKGNPAGHLMHWLDRGGYIRDEADYRRFFAAGFDLLRTTTMRSGICDYGVYVLRRKPADEPTNTITNMTNNVTNETI
jgi:SAM-dependent methyltransferase